jgi:hypothetical protein
MVSRERILASGLVRAPAAALVALTVRLNRGKSAF